MLAQNHKRNKEEFLGEASEMGRSTGCAFVTVASPLGPTRCCHIVTREAKSAISTLKGLTWERGATDVRRKAISDCPGPIPIGCGIQREGVRLGWDKEEDLRNHGLLGRSHQAHTTFWVTEKSKCVNMDNINIKSQFLICKAGI